MKKDSLVAVVLVGIIIMVNAQFSSCVCCRTVTPYARVPYAVNGAAFVGGMGGGGASGGGRVPNRHPSTLLVQ